MTLETASLWYLKEEWGFKTHPPEGTDEILLRAIMTCAQGDGELADAERDWITGFGAMLNVGEDKLEGLRSFEPSEPVVSVMEQDPMVAEFGRRVTVYFAIRASQADGVLAPRERASIEKMGSAAGLPPEVVGQLFALVEAEDTLKALRRQLVMSEGVPF